MNRAKVASAIVCCALGALGSAQSAPPAGAGTSAGQTPPGEAPAAKPQDHNLHFQTTTIVQGYPGFHAPYSGTNSLDHVGEVQHTTTLDIFGGKRLWNGAELHVDGLVWQGFGLGKTFGIEAFPNGDAYKYGTETPYFMFARLFVRQTFGLGGPKEDVADTPLTLAGRQDVKRLTLTVGRFTPTDVSDTNTYAGSPHTQFMNWGLINNLAWDYAADSVGFDSGFTAELNEPRWALRYGFFLLPLLPNSFTGDDQFLMWPHEGAFGPLFKEWAMNAEFEYRYTRGGHPGAIRPQVWLNQANMATYAAATSILQADGPGADWQAARSFRYKYGFGLNWEQELKKDVGAFSRLGWNDGREEAWAFTDATWTGSLGLSLDGDAWRRPGDKFGLAGIVSGASTAEQKFLEAGGTGILDGDGALKYEPEGVLETYYDTQVFRGCRVALDYQFVANPAFNRARGPVSIFALRLHYEF